MSYSTSLFSQILRVVPAGAFARAVRETRAERHSKGFTCWDQFVAMLFCQFAQAKSLREVCDGLRVTCGKLNHLGLRNAPSKSTLAYANAHRPWELYARLFGSLLSVCQAEAPGKKTKFRFKNKLFSLDASMIDLCLSLFPWATFVQTKGAVKLHLLLDHDGYLPTFAVVTEGNVHDVNIAWQVSVPKGSIIVVDRGYCDYALFHEWNEKGVFFVTRLKDNTAYEVLEDRRVPQDRNILSDQIIRFTVFYSKKRYPSTVRRIVVWDETNKREIELLTNHLGFGATTISAIYKDRWEIELFFKVLKQHLKIKTFVGTTANALKTQIWTALITMLLIKYLQFRSKCGWALCRLFALLRLNLFSYRNLWDWLNNPFDVPPEQPPYQLELAIKTA
jgi:hypothetical protein